MIEDLYKLIIAQVIAANLNVVSELLSLILRLFSLKTHSYRIRGRNILTEYIKKGFYTSEYDDMPTGFICGYYYIGSITKNANGNNREVFDSKIICTQAQWDKMMGKVKFNKFNSQYDQYIDGSGIRNINCNLITPRPLQKKIISKIIGIYKDQGYASVFISGHPGVGKTKIAGILAQQMNAVIIKTSADQCVKYMNGFYNDVAPNHLKPLIILLDEIDDSIKKIINPPALSETQSMFEPSPDNKLTKRTWNQLFDNIDDGIFPNCIFILISNLTKDEIDKSDSSLLRRGRINQYIQMSNENVVFSY
jgi:hypothetical protein